MQPTNNRMAIEAGLKATEITSEMLDNVAAQVVGHPLKLGKEIVNGDAYKRGNPGWRVLLRHFRRQSLP
jgi:hypothetical protein